MALTQQDKLKALAIIGIFETSRPFAEYGAVAVLDDGAGISYGIGQFTHRSGALLAVIVKYLSLDGRVGRLVLEEKLPLLRSKKAAAIKTLSSDETLRKVLKAAAVTREMRIAQTDVLIGRYLRPAIRECARLGFEQPLSLAVVYDSMTHGSWERLRDHTSVRATGSLTEKGWIDRYVRVRDAWLASVPRLRKTRYRTQFFVEQIRRANWGLALPILVNGFDLTSAVLESAFGNVLSEAATADPKPGPGQLSSGPTPEPAQSMPADDPQVRARAEDPIVLGGGELLEEIEDAIDRSAAVYDRVEDSVNKVITRTYSARSMWAMAAGVVCQAFWGAVSFITGHPVEFWLAVTLAAAGLIALYVFYCSPFSKRNHNTPRTVRR